MVNDEIIGAYLDGELDAEKRDWVERQLQIDKGAAARLERMRAADKLLKLAMPQIDQPGDDLLAAGILAQRPAESWTGQQRWASAAAALAATLVFGFAIGRLVEPGQQALPLALSAEHARLLDTLPSGQAVSTGAGVFEVVLSVRSEAGEVCRQLRVNDGARNVDALACRSENGWQMTAASASPIADGYVPASGVSPIDSAIQALGPVEVIDLDQERQNIAAGWAINR